MCDENACDQQQVMSDTEDEVLPSEDRSATDVILPNGRFSDIDRWLYDFYVLFKILNIWHKIKDIKDI